jgi:DNA-binding NarL/FixJ family response regulator
MRIFLADDQAKVCSALRLLLEQEPGLSVVGEAAEAKDLLAQVQRTRPDLVLLDWELPGLRAPRSSTPSAGSGISSGQRLLAALHSLSCRVKVIALSGHLEAREEALAAGADAFVSKGDPPERLLTTLRTISVTSWLTDKTPILGVTNPDSKRQGAEYR